MDSEHFSALNRAKRQNYAQIYKNDEVKDVLDAIIRPMMQEIYGSLLDDLKNNTRNSPIFTHHIAYVTSAHYKREFDYKETEPNQIVVDYIASMTDDYFIDLYSHLFPQSDKKIKYIGYFD